MSTNQIRQVGISYICLHLGRSFCNALQPSNLAMFSQGKQFSVECPMFLFTNIISFNPHYYPDGIVVISDL